MSTDRATGKLTSVIDSEQTASAGIRAAYGLASRMTNSRAAAEEAVSRAARRSGLEQTPLVRATRAEARGLGGRPQPASVPRPMAFHDVALGGWAVLERIALRGMTISEAAAELGVSRPEVIVRLQCGMRAARGCIEQGEVGDDAQATTRAAPLGRDRATRGPDDPARNG